MRTLVIDGLGLLGGSIAQAMKGKPQWRVIGVSSAESLTRAKSRSLCDEYVERSDAATWCSQADVVLLCGTISGVLSSIELLRKFLPAGKPVLVSDIGSTKRAICQAGQSLPSPALFVGGHPMAGSEKRGADHADPGLFENAYWIFCPPMGAEPQNWQPLLDIAHGMGSITVTLPADEHDSLMAHLSHVPQLVSTALAGGFPRAFIEKGEQHLAGRGFRDMTRIAASAFPMWRDILLTNSDEIAKALATFTSTAAALQAEVQALPASIDQVGEHFRRGQEVRSTLSNPGKGFAHGLCEVLVRIPDSKGSLLAMLQPLSDAGLDIRDFELLKVREGVGGTVLLAFQDEPTADKAVLLLNSIHLEAHRR